MNVQMVCIFGGMSWFLALEMLIPVANMHTALRTFSHMQS